MDTRLLDVARFEATSPEISTVLKLLSNKHRLLTVCHLTQGELSVGSLENRLGISQSSLSQHLARLRERGVVEFRKESTTVYYRIADPSVKQLINVLYQLYCTEELSDDV